jgi:predicted transcriptional regulator
MAEQKTFDELAISSQRQDHLYFTMIPNVIWYFDLSPADFKLYNTIVKTTGADGHATCFKTTETLAQEAGLSTGAISKSKANLRRAGLITIQARKRSRGGRPIDHINIVDIWAENALFFRRVFSSNEPAPRLSSLKELQELVYSRDEKTSEVYSRGEKTQGVYSPREPINSRGELEEEPLNKSELEEEETDSAPDGAEISPPSPKQSVHTEYADLLPPADVQADVLFGPGGKRDKVAVARPSVVDEWGGPLRELADHLGIDVNVMPEKQAAQWARRLRKIAETWRVKPVELTRAIRRLFESKEYSWKTYSGPFGAFETDLGVILGRMASQEQRQEAQGAKYAPPQTAEWVTTERGDMSELERAWTRAQEELQHMMTKATYDAWLRAARLVARSNGTVRVAVATPAAQEWCTRRLGDVVARVLQCEQVEFVLTEKNDD